VLCDEPEVADCDPDAETDPLELVAVVELPEVLPLVEVVDDEPVALVVAPFLCVAARQPPRPTKPVTLSAVTMRRARHAADRRLALARVVRAPVVFMPCSVGEPAVAALWTSWTTS
jgi:hypothetical protein